MSLVWRKIQRSNKKAAKFRFVATFQELSIQCSNKWQPTKVGVSWVHRRRRYSTKSHKWEPTITDPYKGLIVWPATNPEVLEMTTTMYRDSRHETFDDKEWTFIVEEMTGHNNSKHKPIAGVNLNMRLFINEQPGTKTELKLKLKPLREHMLDCRLQLILICQALGEGDALDDDMQSVASQMSIQHSIKDLTRDNLPEIELESGESLGSLEKLDVVKEPSGGSGTAGSKSDLDENFDTKINGDSGNRVFQFAKKKETEKPLINTIVDKRKSTENKLIENLQKEQAHISKSPQQKQQQMTSPLQNKLQNDQKQQAEQQQSSSNNESNDLLTWCKEMTKDYYPKVKIDDFSVSWRNGLAFCALIHRFRPDLISDTDFQALKHEKIRDNCQLAFDSAANLGVPRIIDPNTMVILAIPDKIEIMTYVYLLRNHFTNQQQQGELQSKSITTADYRSITKSATSYIDQLKHQKSGSASINDRLSSNFSPINKDNPLTNQINTASSAQKSQMMTHNQFMNPFDSDDDIAKTPQKSLDNDKTPIKDDKTTLKDIIVEKTDIVGPKNDILGHKTDIVGQKTDIIVNIKQEVVHENHIDQIEQQISTTVIDTNKSHVTPIDASKSHVTPIDSSKGHVTPTSTSSSTPGIPNLTTRTLKLLEQYEKQIPPQQTQNLNEQEDEKRRQELKERARRLIEGAINSPSANSGAFKTIKMSETISSTDFVPVKPQIPKSLSAPVSRQTTPDSKTVTDSPISGQLQSNLITKESLQDETRRVFLANRQKSDGPLSPVSVGGAVDQFVRFGSMRGQELARNLTILSSRLAQTVRSQSAPKEIDRPTKKIDSTPPKKTTSPVTPIAFSPIDSSPLVSRNGPMGEEEDLDDDDQDTEHQTKSRDQIVREMEAIVLRQQELDKKAVQVEQKWRQIITEGSTPGASEDEEKRTMNEYLALLNERNMLTRREMHLSLLESVQDYESKFRSVQRQLGQLIKIEDSEKTESHKQQIDRLMNELIDIVNKRDELMQQVMANEQGSEEDAELASHVMTSSSLMMTSSSSRQHNGRHPGDKESCSIQ